MPICFLSPSALSFLIADLHGYNKMICQTENMYSLPFTEKAHQPLVPVLVKSLEYLSSLETSGQAQVCKIL